MPYPEKGEDKQHYISRCIPYIIKEKGVESDQAAAICYSLWSKNEDKHLNNIDILIEKYIPTKVGSVKLAVYENPTILDLKSLKDDGAKFARFFVHMGKELLYVWDASDELHHKVWNSLKLKPTMEEYGYEENHIMVAGYGRITGNKIVVDNLMYDREYYDDLPDLSQYPILSITKSRILGDEEHDEY